MSNVVRPFGRLRPSGQIKVPANLRQGSVRYASKQVSVPFVTAAAISLLAMFTGTAVLIADSEWGNKKKGCVDENGIVVPNSNCQESDQKTGTWHYPHRWHYGARNYTLGSPVIGGSFDAPSSSTTRGIFGGRGLHFSFGS